MAALDTIRKVNTTVINPFLQRFYLLIQLLLGDIITQISLIKKCGVTGISILEV